MNVDVEAIQKHWKSVFTFLAFSRMHFFDVHVDYFKKYLGHLEWIQGFLVGVAFLFSCPQLFYITSCSC